MFGISYCTLIPKLTAAPPAPRYVAAMAICDCGDDLYTSGLGRSIEKYFSKFRNRNNSVNILDIKKILKDLESLKLEVSIRYLILIKILILIDLID